MTRESFDDPSHREERVVKTLGHRRGGDSWATPGIFIPTVEVLPGTTGTEQLQPQAGQEEVLPTMSGQRDGEVWSLALPRMPHLESHILVGVLGCCRVEVGSQALICVPQQASGQVLLVLG